MTDSLQGCRQGDGDAEASVGRSFDVRRFTREEHERGATTGWYLWCGWFERDGGLRWAWFRKDVDDDAK